MEESAHADMTHGFLLSFSITLSRNFCTNTDSIFSTYLD